MVLKNTDTSIYKLKNKFNINPIKQYLTDTDIDKIYDIIKSSKQKLVDAINKMFLDKSADILTQSIIFISIGATLLGYRKSKDSGVTDLEEVKEEEVKDDQTLNS
jgi:hypothetical protein